jgi:hypothetical protein
VKQVILEAAAALGADPDAPMQLAILDNEIAEGNYKQNNEVQIKMSDSEMTQYSNDWRTYQERNVLLMKHRGQAEENLQQAHLSKRVILEAAATLGADPDAPM